jgi:peptidoglycan/LPS O-acetylase OafA/YrhL
MTAPGTTTPGTTTPGTTAPAPVRLAWLDALRGYAALVVVCFHLSPVVLGNQRHLAILRHIDLGKYGVLLFFLVSGYVIPMSLEHHGSLRRFWIGRLCRIYPAYLAAIALVAVLAATGLLAWPAGLRHETVTGVLAHATMMPDLLGQRGAIRVFWTLAYEMTFYLIVSGLFAWRLHRHSTWWAAGLALTALLAGPRLPDNLFGATFTSRRITAAVLVLLTTLSILAYVRRRLVLTAGTAGIALVLLPALNGHSGAGSTVIASWQGLLLLAVMFAGTVVYRAQHSQTSRPAATAALATVAVCIIGSHWTHLDNPVVHRVWLTTTAAVTLTFLGAYALRNRPVPAAFTWLGRISYSLYLLHVVVLFMIPHIVPDLGTQPLAVRAAAGLAYLAAALGLAAVAYRTVEKPGQALGRWLVARPVTRRAAPPRMTTQRAVPPTGRGRNQRESV